MDKIEVSEEKRPLILIIDDVPKNLQILGNILQREGYQITAATTGLQALNIVEKVLPDLILLDIMMPEMNGFEVCEKLKKFPRTKDIPFIFLTAKTETEDIVKGFQLGAVDYVTKPFNSVELLARVKTHLEIKKNRDIIVQANKQLKELNATKDKFFSIISHDLKSPFTVIMGLSEYLAEEILEIRPEELREYAFRILDSSRRAYDLVNNLLDWAQVQTGKMEVYPSKFDLAEITGKVITLFKENAQRKRITLGNEIKKGTFVYADHNMIETVIRNLVSNGMKFTNENGEVKISATQENDSVEVVVTDTGVGMSKEAMENLFRLDACLSTVGTNGEKGTGLGLILSKDFIEKNKGKLRLESELDQGTTFFISIPCAPVA